MKKIIWLLLLAPCICSAQSIVTSSIDSGGGSDSAGNIEMLYTIGEVMMVQERCGGNLQLNEEFINPIMALNTKIGPITLLGAGDI